MNDSPLPVVRNVQDLRVALAAWRAAGETVGLVPTMGALHDGHVSLVRAAKEKCDRAVASIFVNKLQFSPGGYFEDYPRDEARDAALLTGAGCDLLYAPDEAAMFPSDAETCVEAPVISSSLEGEFWPSMLGGFATCATTLLNQVQPDATFVGEKDYQQLLLLKRLVRDLCIPTEIVALPTVREHDGLALSWRNANLNADQRRVAVRLNAVLHETIRELHAGEVTIAEAEAEATRHLIAAGFIVDYVAVRDSETLAPIADLSKPARILAAAYVRKIRLTDNMAA